MADFTSLPPGVQGRIFLCLSHLGLLSFKLRLVSKSWNSLIVPIKFQSWELKKVKEHVDPDKLRSKTWPDTWVYSKIKKYARSITVCTDVDENVAGFLNGLRNITAISIAPDEGYQGSLAWENMAQPVFRQWLPVYLVRLTSISLHLVKMIDFLESIQPKDIPRLKHFATDTYCSENHASTPNRCLRASRLLVKFVASYKMLRRVDIRVTDTDLGLAEALSYQRKQLRSLSVRDTAPSIKPLSITFTLSPQSLTTLAQGCQNLTQLTVDLPAHLFFIGDTSCAVVSRKDPRIGQWIHAVAAFPKLRRLYIHTYTFQTWELHRGRVTKFDNHNDKVEAAARELTTRLTFAKKGVLFDEIEIRYKVFRGKQAPPHSTPRKGISVVNCWLYKYISRYYLWHGALQGVSSVFSKETLGYDAWPEP